MIQNTRTCRLLLPVNASGHSCYGTRAYAYITKNGILSFEVNGTYESMGTSQDISKSVSFSSILSQLQNKCNKAIINKPVTDIKLAYIPVCESKGKLSLQPYWIFKAQQKVKS